ncbi:MAG: heavy metal translocating P-type ATPase [Clostridiales bacterium]|nr:heavy metal translocating P-type ATPase [Clostridiales bacterium]
MPDEDCIKKVYLLENLGCANCAAKMEKKIKELPGVTYATITYTTKQLRLSAKDPDALLPQIQAICSAIESEVKVVPRTKSQGTLVTRTYTVENLGCANCAAKMEKRINELEGITTATLTFATKQLRVSGKNPDGLFEEMQKICSTIESEVKLVPKDTRPKSKDTLNVNEILPEARQMEPPFTLSDNMKTLLGIGLGAVLFILGEVLEHQGMDTASLLVLLVGYVVLGGRIVLTAVKNLFKGQIFDENFLMSIATLGAFAIREYPEAVGVMLFYRIGEYFEHIAVEKSRGQIMDAVDMRPEVVNLVVGEDVRVIDAEDANVGDILLIRPGDRIPLDGVIVDGESRLDTSPVTGEPVPVKVGYGDEVVSGCVNTSGLLKIRVEKILEESMVTRILDSVENAAASKPKIDRFITRFARIYTPVVVILAAATAIIPSLVTGNWYYYIYTALTFLVMSCPCALVLSVPLAFFSGIGAGSKRGILFKGGVALEAMRNVDAVVMDKTGTITKGNFVVQRAVPATSDVSQDELLSLCASCELTSTHPIGVSILSAAKEQHVSYARPISVEEIAGHGIRAVIPVENNKASLSQSNSNGTGNGASMSASATCTVLCGNRKLMEKYGISLDNYEKKGFGTEVLTAKDGVFIGHLVISDTIKEDAKSAISQIKSLGIETVMLTGDAEDSAQAVADATGIDEVHAKLLPQDKLTELIQVRNSHGSVMFVGDGINDAPVLAGADVGAAMGSGADAAIEAADVVFMTSSMEAIPQSLAIARATSAIAWQNVVFALVIKVLVMILGLCGFASMWMAVFADTGVAMLCVLNSIRVLYKKKI